jgi:hypothetical protein
MKTTMTLMLFIILTSCSVHKYSTIAWEDDIHNPNNEEFVVETAFSLGISSKKVTQQQFNERYLPQPQSLTSKN